MNHSLIRRCWLAVLLVCGSMLSVRAADGYACNCFCVIAGSGTTADGSVMLAHNEDDSGEMMLNLYAVAPGEDGGGYLWGEFPGTRDCDHFLNRWGVAIASDGCPSREDRDDVTDGGVLYETRQTVARQAHSAREAVKLIGHLVETRGYLASGRTYVIADPREGWICSVVRGRHWVAKRIPDNEVMALPNNYIIDKVDLTDTLNYYGAADVVDYAIGRGWYVPATDGPFSFKRAYGDPKAYVYEHNVVRHLCALQYLTGRTFEPDPDTFPFSVVPDHKLTRQDLMQIMACHGENSPHKFVYTRPRPWTHPVCICTDVTVLSAIFQLRSWLPPEVGCVMWVCAGRPCSEPYMPWYLGVTETPSCWRRYASAAEALARHFDDLDDKRTAFPQSVYWQGVDRWAAYATDWQGGIERVQERRDSLQRDANKQFEQMERRWQRHVDTATCTVTRPADLAREINAFEAGLYR